MTDWAHPLRVNPVPALLASGDEALRHFTRCDLLEERGEPTERLWELPEPQRVLRKQRDDGSWKHRGTTKYRYPTINSDLAETLRCVSLLVEKHGFTDRHPAIPRAADYLFSCQTEEGDFRGILGTQYTPYYQGLIMEMLIQVGYANDSRIGRGFEWLLWCKQSDGGWMLPIQTGSSRDRDIYSRPPIPFDPSLPSSHFATGMVLRAFAVHPQRRRSKVAWSAAEFLKSRFFQRDTQTARQAPGYWTKLQFPFWWPNLLTALDSVARMGFPSEDEDVQRGLRWFVDHLRDDGLWSTGYESGKNPPREREAADWVTLAVCRMLKRFHR
jgi:Squalene-hopene cyclase C-terminal domain